MKRETVSVHQASNRSPGERRDIRNFLGRLSPAYRCAHAGHLLTNSSGGKRCRFQLTKRPQIEAAFIVSLWNAFYIAQRGPGHGIAVRYGYEPDLAFAAGAIIDQNRGPVSHVQRLLFDDDLRSAHPARGKYGS